MELAAQVMVVRLDVALGGLLDDRLVGGQQGPPQRLDHLRGDLVLDGEHVVQAAVVGVGPEVVAAARIDQLRRDPDLVALLAHAALEDVGHAEPLADGAQVLLLALEGEGGGAPGDAEILDPGQHVEQLLGQALGEILVVRVHRHVDEGQHRDGQVAVRPRRRPAGSAAPRPARRVAFREMAPGEQADRDHQQQAMVAISSLRFARCRSSQALRSTSLSRLMPSGVISKAQARIRANGKPSARTIATSRSEPSGASRISSSTSATCRISQAPAP
jgi:hypothetical protein